jgi:hypothetical protein
MDVTAQIKITADERQEMAAILGCSQVQLAENLSDYASAALAEYVSMMLGQKVFRRGSDILEYRLFLLITKAFGNKIPDEQSVCRIFQVTASESRSLIRSVMSKFQYQLKKAITTSMRKIVVSAETPGNGQPYVATIYNKNLVDSLNVLLAERDGSLQPVVKKRGSVSDYKISPASYNALCQILEIE